MKNAILVAALLGLAACGSSGDGTVVPQDNGGAGDGADGYGTVAVLDNGGGVPPFGASAEAATFISNFNGTVTHSTTGLVWLKDANCYGSIPWQSAMDSAKLLAHNECGRGLKDYSKAGDWRLATVDELRAFANADPKGSGLFSNVQDWYWTSDTYYNTLRAYVVSFSWWDQWGVNNKSDNRFVWPVRLAPTGYVAQGGLTWMPNNAIPPSGWATWAAANAYCTDTIINGLTGWRLPTKDELVSLYNTPGALAGQGWTLSNTRSSTQNGAQNGAGGGSHFNVSLNNGKVYWDLDVDNDYVTCVR